MRGILDRLRGRFNQKTSGRRLQGQFDEIEDFREWSYERVLNVIGVRADQSRFDPDGCVRRTWSKGRYSITLLFDNYDRCLGVEEEKTQKRGRKR